MTIPGEAGLQGGFGQAHGPRPGHRNRPTMPIDIQGM